MKEDLTVANLTKMAENAEADTALAAEIAAAGGGQDIHTLSWRGKDVVIVMKRPSWFARNKAISKATEYEVTEVEDDHGNKQQELTTRLRLDKYYKALLRELIVQAPFGRSDAALESLPADLGQQLEKILPGPFGVLEELGQEKKESNAPSKERRSRKRQTS